MPENTEVSVPSLSSSGSTAAALYEAAGNIDVQGLSSDGSVMANLHEAINDLYDHDQLALGVWKPPYILLSS